MHPIFDLLVLFIWVSLSISLRTGPSSIIFIAIDYFHSIHVIHVNAFNMYILFLARSSQSSPVQIEYYLFSCLFLRAQFLFSSVIFSSNDRTSCKLLSERIYVMIYFTYVTFDKEKKKRGPNRCNNIWIQKTYTDKSISISRTASNQKYNEIFAVMPPIYWWMNEMDVTFRLFISHPHRFLWPGSGLA